MWGWVEEDRIARYALWLRDNRVVRGGNRFAVQGDIQHVRRVLTTRNKVNSLCVEWLVKHIDEPNEQLDRAQRVLYGAGRVHVNPSFLQRNWEQYIHSSPAPSLQAVGRALKNLGNGQAHKYNNIRFRSIDTATLITWARENQVGDPDILRGKIDALNNVVEQFGA